jgi:hypothetical protein
LNELHERRPVFRYGRDDSLLLASFLSRLKESKLARKWTGYNQMATERAYDLTLDKFTNLPAQNMWKRRSLASRGPDCRYYYRAFHEHTTARLSWEEAGNPIREELVAAASLQRLVMRHFYLSCLESKRRAQRLVRRYVWQKNGCSLGIWMPSLLPGRRCRQWLEANVPDCDPTRAGERRRVQDIVNQRLTRPREIPLDEVNGGADSLAASTDSVSSMIEEEIFNQGLARTVAQEKAENLDGQRPAIRALGKDKLEELICQVFKGLSNDTCPAKDLARAFHLTPVTFSRFAGSQWMTGKRRDPSAQLPDLWQNTARILANHSGFRQAAGRAGLLAGTLSSDRQQGHQYSYTTCGGMPQMNRELYFVPILAAALVSPESGATLDRAFEEISRLGGRGDYAVGFENFRRFMEHVSSCHHSQEQDDLRQMMLELATGTVEPESGWSEGKVRLVESNRERQGEYEQLCHQVGPQTSHGSSVAIQVYAGRKQVSELALDRPGIRRSIRRITPGPYLLRLRTGLVVWQGELTGADLLWTEAFRSKSLDVAAQTCRRRRRATRKVPLGDGSIIMRLFAGIEAGEIELERTE